MPRPLSSTLRLLLCLEGINWRIVRFRVGPHFSWGAAARECPSDPSKTTAMAFQPQHLRPMLRSFKTRGEEGIPGCTLRLSVRSSSLYSGMPHMPQSVAAAGQLINNPMMSAAAMHYGSELAQRSQAYVDQGVSTCSSHSTNCSSFTWCGVCVCVCSTGQPRSGHHQSQVLLCCGH